MASKGFLQSLSFKGKMIVLVDSNFHSKDGKGHENIKECKRGRWDESVLIKTAFSVMARVFNFKKMVHRVWGYLMARVTFAFAAFNILAGQGMKIDEKGFFLPLYC